MRRRAYLLVALSLPGVALFDSISNSETSMLMAEAMAPSTAVTLLEPASNSVVYSGHPKYIWTSAGGPDSMSGFQYELHVSPDSNLTFPEVLATLTDTTQWQLSPLDIGGRHWWKVISRDSLGTATESAIGSFHVYLPGDVNESHDITTADIIRIVNFVFKSASLGVQECAADINGEADVTSGDIVYLVDHVFRGGAAPEPSCVTEASMYWPLAEGNYWLYQLCWGTQPCVDSAHRMEIVSRGADTAVVLGQPWWNDTLRLRQQGPAIDWRWPDTGWNPFYRFRGGTWARPDGPWSCNDTMFFAIPQADSIVTPAGTFHGYLRVLSVRHCSDAGMFEEWWAPGVGLIGWVQDNFAGARRFYLSDYRAKLD